MKRILIIEDEIDIAELIGFNLKRHEFEVFMVHDGVEGVNAVFSTNPHLIILDVMMPKLDGFQVLKELRNDQRTKKIPVLMLTAKAQMEDKIRGLEQGVDDYLTKPFSPKELVLRVKAILKRVNVVAQDNLVNCKPFSFDTATLQFFAGEQLIDLTSTEFKLMLFLCKNLNTVQDRQTLLSEVWGYHEDVNSRTLDTHMKRLRQKLGDYSQFLETVRGVGYKIVPLS
jgi:two-component system, OmpR family, phosphate regulon response regulator PhoB